MNLAPRILARCLPAILLIAGHVAAIAASKDEARVTRVIRNVELLPPQSKAKAASVNDTVDEDTSVRTGEKSRSELTFTDLTITRLGANTIFSFNKAGHDVQLNAGSVLLYVPKDSGGAHMATEAVSVAITGSTAILTATRRGRSLLTMLEDGARVSLIKHPRESVYVRQGQMVNVPPGATKMPRPININVKQAMKSPLITDFSPLPSQNAILAGSNNPPVYRSNPVGPGPGPGGPIVGQPVGGGYPAYPPGHSHQPPVVVVNPDYPDKPGKHKKHHKPNPDYPDKPGKHKKPGKPKPTPTPGGHDGGKGHTKKPSKRPGPKPTPTPRPHQIP